MHFEGFSAATQAPKVSFKIDQMSEFLLLEGIGAPF